MKARGIYKKWEEQTYIIELSPKEAGYLLLAIRTLLRNNLALPYIQEWTKLIEEMNRQDFGIHYHETLEYQ